MIINFDLKFYHYWVFMTYIDLENDVGSLGDIYMINLSYL